jgi:peptide-methionine (S)-S-oxide reductase
MQKATFGAGCFWGVEAAYQKIKGVISTTVGYMGGNFDNPRYEDVCSGDTGHAEVITIVYNESIVTYEDLLKIFWEIHNPTQLNRQGVDIGTQYRSVIFYYNENQKEIAKKSKENQQKLMKNNKKIVTQILPAKKFYPAEEYHQKYLEKQGFKSCGL